VAFADSARQTRDHAVVIGASVAGLLAARAFTDAYARVIVIDRDVLQDGPEVRRASRKAGRLIFCSLAVARSSMSCSPVSHRN
jgi:glycine/D-amino acid oxidase-like deaminating enzyme